MQQNITNYDDTNYEYIEWTDSEVTTKCSNILYDFKDFAKYYAFAFTSFDISDLISQGNYLELGKKGSNINSFICFGNHNMCICFLNADTRNIVRRMTISYYMITGIKIDEKAFETIITFYLNNDIIKFTIPNKAIGTKLNHQKQMKENIVQLVSTLNKIER